MLEAKKLELAGCYHQEPMSYPALLAWCPEAGEGFFTLISVIPEIIWIQRYRQENRLFWKRSLALCVILTMAFSPTLPVLQQFRPIGGLEREYLSVQPDHVVGVLKAYSTCVGAGPFVAENAMPEEWKESLRKAGGEYGAATGRPRRVRAI